MAQTTQLVLIKLNSQFPRRWFGNRLLVRLPQWLSGTVLPALCAFGMLSGCSLIFDSAPAPAPAPDPDPDPSYQVGGEVSGLSGELTLALNGAELVIIENGTFSFAAPLADNDPYEIVIRSQPQGQYCDINNASGTVTGANVGDVDLECLNGLLGLTLSPVPSLTAAFDPGQLLYQVDVSVLTSEVTVTPMALPDVTAAIQVDGTAVLSGAASAPIALNLGSNTITVDVLEEGKFLSYLLEVNRGAGVVEQIAYGKVSNPGAKIRFANSVSLSGDTLAVGAYLEDSGATGIDGTGGGTVGNSGAVYVFRRTGDTWAQEAYIKASNTGGNDRFGSSVSLSGDTLAVGALFEDSDNRGIIDPNGPDNDNSVDSGAVYVFRRSGGTWAQEAHIKASNTGAEDQFGTSVSLSGDTLAVGAHLEDSDGIDGEENNNDANSGAVYVFRRSGGTWIQDAYVKASITGSNDQFGFSVSLSGDTLAVGAFLEDSTALGIGGEQANNSANNSGAVYVFRGSGGTWDQAAYIKASNTKADDRFGHRVSLSGDVLAVSASFEASNATGIGGEQADISTEDSGAVYLFYHTGNTWAQDAYIKASNTGAGDRFGESVSLSGDTLAVGAFLEDSNATGFADATGLENDNDNDNAMDSGAIYIFQ